MARKGGISAPVATSPDPADFPIRERGFGYADFNVGRTFEHANRRTVLESDNALFTTWSLAFNQRYIDREAAVREGEPDLVVNPLLVFSIVFGLTVEDLSEHTLALLGVDKLRFGTTVHAGDTLRATSVVHARRRSQNGPRGIVTWHTQGFNQHDELVVDFLRSNLFAAGETE
jgi:itaconyl-CoA hydratase